MKKIPLSSFPKTLHQCTPQNISSTLWRHSSASELGDSTKESSSKREEDRLPAPRLHFSTKVEVKNALLLAATTIPPPSTTGEIPHIKQLPLISKTTCIPKKIALCKKKMRVTEESATYLLLQLEYLKLARPIFIVLDMASKVTLSYCCNVFSILLIWLNFDTFIKERDSNGR